MSKQSKKKKEIDPNLMIAIGVLISSFAALFVYIRQTSIMNEQTKILLEQTKANAWPHLSIELHRGYSRSGLHTYKYVIDNKGTGPAIIEKVVISVDGKAVKNWQEFYTTIQIPDTINVSHSNENIHQRVLSSNQNLTLIDWSNTNNEALIKYIYSQADKIKVQICYKSIHGDIWNIERHGFLTDLEATKRAKVEFCDLGEEVEFLQ